MELLLVAKGRRLRGASVVTGAGEALLGGPRGRPGDRPREDDITLSQRRRRISKPNSPNGLQNRAWPRVLLFSFTPRPRGQCTSAARMASTDTASVPSKKEETAGDGIDITGDGGVLKKILREGSGWEQPKGGAEVRPCFLRSCAKLMQMIGASSLRGHAARR